MSVHPLLAKLFKRMDGKLLTQEESDALDRKADIRYWRERARYAGIPSRPVKMIITGYDHYGKPFRESKAKTALTRSLRSGSTIVVLGGPTGTGKTAAAAWWILTGEMDCQWTSSVDMAKSALWDAERGRLEAVPMLVIDDAGLNVEYPKLKHNIEALIYKRAESERLKTVITTNYLWSEFVANYEDRAARRVKSCGEFINCTGVVCPARLEELRSSK